MAIVKALVLLSTIYSTLCGKYDTNASILQTLPAAMALFEGFLKYLSTILVDN